MGLRNKIGMFVYLEEYISLQNIRFYVSLPLPFIVNAISPLGTVTWILCLHICLDSGQYKNVRNSVLYQIKDRKQSPFLERLFVILQEGEKVQSAVSLRHSPGLCESVI